MSAEWVSSVPPTRANRIEIMAILKFYAEPHSSSGGIALQTASISGSPRVVSCLALAGIQPVTNDGRACSNRARQPAPDSVWVDTVRKLMCVVRR